MTIKKGQIAEKNGEEEEGKYGNKLVRRFREQRVPEHQTLQIADQSLHGCGCHAEQRRRELRGRNFKPL